MIAPASFSRAEAASALRQLADGVPRTFVRPWCRAAAKKCETATPGLAEVPTMRKPRRWDAVSARLAVCIAGRNRRRR